MAAELIIAPEAERDIEEAYDWYEGQRVGLGEEFLGCVDASIEGICRWPQIYAVIYEHYRRALVRRFTSARLRLVYTWRQQAAPASPQGQRERKGRPVRRSSLCYFWGSGTLSVSRSIASQPCRLRSTFHTPS